MNASFFDVSFIEIRSNWINFTKFLCFWDDRILMKSFAKMLAVKTHCMIIVSFCIFWRNQWRCMFTWRNLMINFVVDIMKIRMIWRLSHSIYVSFFIFIFIESKNRFHHILMLTIIDMINSSISIELIIIVFCFVIFQSMKSSKSLKQYSFEF